MFRETFVQAIRDKRKVRITFFSKEDGGTLTRVCAPMDYAPGRSYRDGLVRYWVWDYESDSPKGPHSLGILPNDVRQMMVTDELFNPDEFTRTFRSPPSWVIPREW